MRFQVPQFIDIEDKVFGPFTFKQFVYLGGGAGICFLLLRVLPKLLAIPGIIVVAVLALALAFYRVNNKPFIQLVESFFMYLIGSRLYIWKRKERSAKPADPLTEHYVRMETPKMSGSKLKDMTWQLDARKNEDGV